MQNTLRLLAAAAVVAAVPRLLLAADAPATPAAPAAPAIADTLASAGIVVNGYAAASYYASNGYPGGGAGTYPYYSTGFSVHQFDVRHDTFQVDQAGIMVAYQPKDGFGGVAEVIAGEDARLLKYAEDGSSDTPFDIKQAFAQYASGPWTVILGKYVTLAGAEVITPSLNTNFSRSLLFTLAEPLTHTGVRATYAVSDQVSLIAGVNNGWNTTSTSYGSKTGELGATWTPNKMFSLAGTAYLGKTQLTDSELTLVDVVATYNATSALTFIVNVDYDKLANVIATETTTGTSLNDAKWWGVAAYANYQFNDQWRASLRLEYFDDSDGWVTSTPGGQKLKEGTLTVGYDPVKSFELRFEARVDKADTNLFLRHLASANVPEGELADSLFEFAVQGVYKFPGM